MPEQQLLRRDTATRVDHQLLPLVFPFPQSGRHVCEERALELAGGVAAFPDEALKGFEGGCFGVYGGEVGDVLDEGGGGAGVGWVKGGVEDVRCEVC